MKLRFAFLLAAVATACDSTEPPAGGTYRAVLESPNGAEGGASIRVTGGGIERITSATGQVFSEANSSGARVVILREPAGTLEFDVVVGPGHGAPTAEVTEVVDGGDQVRPALSGYRVTLTKAGDR